MAYRQMTTRRRQNVQRASYVYGNVVRQPAYEPERRAQEPKKKRTSRQVKKNRRQALRLSGVYAVVRIGERSEERNKINDQAGGNPPVYSLCPSSYIFSVFFRGIWTGSWRPLSV